MKYYVITTDQYESGEIVGIVRSGEEFEKRIEDALNDKFDATYYVNIESKEKDSDWKDTYQVTSDILTGTMEITLQEVEIY